MTAGVTIAALLSGCGTRTLPPLPPVNASTPAAELPDPGPVPWGYGRVQFETTNGPRRVHLVSEVNPRLMWAVTDAEEGPGYTKFTYRRRPDSDLGLVPVCQTPCVVDLPTGQHRVLYETLGSGPIHIETEDLVVTPEPKLHRRAVGSKARFEDSLYSIIFPPLLAVPGLAYGGVGVSNLVTSGDADGDRQQRLRTSGIACIGVGVAMLAAGIYVSQLIRPTEQEGNAIDRALTGRRP